MLKKIIQTIWLKIIGNPVGEDLGFSCCFCNESLTSTDPDPSEIVIVANIDKPKEQQADQIFWCHAQCLKSKLHKNIVNLYVLDDITKQNQR